MYKNIVIGEGNLEKEKKSTLRLTIGSLLNTGVFHVHSILGENNWNLNCKSIISKKIDQNPKFEKTLNESFCSA